MTSFYHHDGSERTGNRGSERLGDPPGVTQPEAVGKVGRGTQACVVPPEGDRLRSREDDNASAMQKTPAAFLPVIPSPPHAGAGLRPSSFSGRGAVRVEIAQRGHLQTVLV